MQFMKSFKYLLIAAILITSFESCRKGPEDPLLSFTTRKNRLADTWEAYEYRIDGIDMMEELQTSSAQVGDCGKQTINTLIERTVLMTFSKSGNYTDNFITKSSISSNSTKQDEDCGTYNYEEEDVETSAHVGKWSFTGGSGGTSKREQVFIYKEETKTGHVWDIVRLAKGELKLRRSYLKDGESTFTIEEINFFPKKK